MKRAGTNRLTLFNKRLRALKKPHNINFKNNMTNINYTLSALKYRALSHGHQALLLVALLLTLMSSPFANAQSKVLILSSDVKDFAEIVSGLTEDLDSDIAFDKMIIKSEASLNSVDKQLAKREYKLIVLIGNTPINVYTKLQQKYHTKKFPPAIVLAALYVDKLIENMRNTTGIRYEIPAVISTVNLRSLLKGKISNVGVIHRSWMRDFIDENAKYCSLEGINLIRYEIKDDDKNIEKRIKAGIKHLQSNGAEALWVVNDNALLNKNSIIKGWLPALKKNNMPVMVNVAPLLKTQLNFGSYGILPDHYGLGVQGSDMILEIMDNEWNIDENQEVEHPISVRKLLNLKVFKKKKIDFDQDKLDELDTIIKE